MRSFVKLARTDADRRRGTAEYCFLDTDSHEAGKALADAAPSVKFRNSEFRMPGAPYRAVFASVPAAEGRRLEARLAELDRALSAKHGAGYQAARERFARLVETA